MSVNPQADFAQNIVLGKNFAEGYFDYTGSPEEGILAWLDASEVKQWWKASDAIIEPYPGGMFYIAWVREDGRYVIYGVVDVVDDEKDCIEVSKILFTSPNGQLGPIKLMVRADVLPSGEARLVIRHEHQHAGVLLAAYNNAVYDAWPKTFAMLKKHLKNKQG